LHDDDLSCIPNLGERDSWYIFDAIYTDIKLKGASFEFQIYEYFDNNIDILDCPVVEGTHLRCNYILPSSSTTIRNLEKDSTYLLRIMPTPNLQSIPSCPDPQNFISIGKTEPNVIDHVEDAESLMINDPFECEHWGYYNISNGTTSDSTIFEDVCADNSLSIRDSWFTFTPLDSLLIISIEQGFLERLDFEIYSGEIGNLICHEANAIIQGLSPLENTYTNRISNLTIGEKYYLRIKVGEISDLVEYEITKRFCLRYVLNPPSNDDLEDALSISPSDNLTDCDLSDSLIYNTPDNDVWFKFEAENLHHQFYLKSSNLSFDSYLYGLEENGDTNLISVHESFPTVFAPTGYNSSGCDEKSGYLRAENFFVSIFNYYDLEIGKEYLIKMGYLFTEEEYQLDIDMTAYEYQYCLKTIPTAQSNTNYTNAENLILFENSESRQLGYLTRSIPDQQEDSLHLDCKVSNNIDLTHIRPEAWYSFTADQSDYSLFFEDLTIIDEDRAALIEGLNLLDSVYLYSLFTKNSNNQLQNIFCDEILQEAQNISNLIEGEEYFIAIRMECLNYLTDLNFQFGLSKLTDLDSDGSYSDVDCDDDNPNINPNQVEEPYNGIDDDCNPITPDDDLDEDGFLLADDCDDNNADINPDAEEIPNNGIDEDCDDEDLVLSIHEIGNSTINIFPNPTIDIINIDIQGKLDYQISMFDLNGKLILTQYNVNRVQVESTPSGVYLFEIKDLSTGQKVVEKIIIEK